MSRTSEIIRHAEARAAQQERYNETHPPITLLTLEQADSQRLFEETDLTVSCDLPCHGEFVPVTYNHLGCNWDRESLQHLVKYGWDMSNGSGSRRLVCNIKGKICVKK